ncbi:hypothetical protein F385_4272 [Pantoea agglomerans 299R]|nr:hypothetical protein F385_4272 [Pantoea agglomerans 299R]
MQTAAIHIPTPGDKLRVIVLTLLHSMSLLLLLLRIPGIRKLFSL